MEICVTSRIVIIDCPATTTFVERTVLVRKEIYAGEENGLPRYVPSHSYGWFTPAEAGEKLRELTSQEFSADNS